MKERIRNLNENEIIKNCRSIIVDLQRGTFKEEHNNEIAFQRQNFEYLITKNMKHIEIKTTTLIDSTEIFKEFLNLFELIFLFYGYFPRISRISIENDFGEIIHINKDNYLTYKYVTSKQHKKVYNKLIDINKLHNLTEIMNKWIELKNNIGLCISGLLMSQMDDLKYIDVINVVLLQSIDGYITNKIYLNKYENTNVNIGNIDNPKYKLMKNCTKREKENIHFSEKLKIFIKDYIQLIFDKESNNNCNRFNNVFDEFIIKCVNSRNRLSHMNYDASKKYFTGIENIYAFYKLLLIFRLNLIHDLTLEKFIIKSNINLNVYYTDKWYIENCNLCNNCIQKPI